MANVKYFFGETEVFHPFGMKNSEFAARFPNVKAKRYDSFSMMVGYSAKDVPMSTRDQYILPIQRSIEFKARPSLHKCDARCQNAKGRICECSCRGKQHGAGNFTCEPVAA